METAQLGLKKSEAGDRALSEARLGPLKSRSTREVPAWAATLKALRVSRGVGQETLAWAFRKDTVYGLGEAEVVLVELVLEVPQLGDTLEAEVGFVPDRPCFPQPLVGLLPLFEKWGIALLSPSMIGSHKYFAQNPLRIEERT